MPIATTTTTAPTSAEIDAMARRLVETDVCYCVSGLVAALLKGAFEPGALIDEDDAHKLAQAVPSVDDFQEAARDAGLWDTPVKPGAADLRRINVERDRFNVWCFTTTDSDGDEDDRGTSYDGTEAGAWRAAFDSAGLDIPDGREVFEHWLVTDDLARRLEAQGEPIARDVQGLTIWGRTTTGQAIYADSVVQDIARAILEA